MSSIGMAFAARSVRYLHTALDPRRIWLLPVRPPDAAPRGLLRYPGGISASVPAPPVPAGLAVRG
jgi:hypothetical protein